MTSSAMEAINSLMDAVPMMGAGASAAQAIDGISWDSNTPGLGPAQTSGTSASGDSQRLLAQFEQAMAQANQAAQQQERQAQRGVSRAQHDERMARTAATPTVSEDLRRRQTMAFGAPNEVAGTMAELERLQGNVERASAAASGARQLHHQAANTQSALAGLYGDATARMRNADVGEMDSLLRHQASMAGAGAPMEIPPEQQEMFDQYVQFFVNNHGLSPEDARVMAQVAIIGNASLLGNMLPERPDDIGNKIKLLDVMGRMASGDIMNLDAVSGVREEAERVYRGVGSSPPASGGSSAAAFDLDEALMQVLSPPPGAAR